MELNEGLKKIFLAGVGAVATTAETAKDVVDNLVKKGELTIEQGKVLNEELKQSAKEKVKEHVSVTVVKEYKDAMAAVEHMGADELEALKAKIAEAEAANAQKCEEAQAVSDESSKEGGCCCEDAKETYPTDEAACCTEDASCTADPAKECSEQACDACDCPDPHACDEDKTL